MTIDHKMLIAALRDMATKVTETREVTRPDYAEMLTARHFDSRREEATRTETVDAYSKDWVAGRLLGMADTLAAMAGEQDGA